MVVSCRPHFLVFFLIRGATACLARFFDSGASRWLRSAMLRTLIGYWMTLIVLLLGASPCSAPFVAPVRGGLLRVKVSCSVVVWLYHPFLFDSVYAPICPDCNNNAPTCNWAKGGSCPTADIVRNNERCFIGPQSKCFTIAGIIKPE